jgi:hypothetical protein
MDFEVVGDITGVETIASGSGIRETRPPAQVVRGSVVGASAKVSQRSGWRRAKSSAPSHTGIELHWYEATGIGKREMKIKAFL